MEHLELDMGWSPGTAAWKLPGVELLVPRAGACRVLGLYSSVKDQVGDDRIRSEIDRIRSEIDRIRSNIYRIRPSIKIRIWIER